MVMVLEMDDGNNVNLHLKIAKMANFMLSTFCHNKKNSHF